MERVGLNWGKREAARGLVSMHLYVSGAEQSPMLQSPPGSQPHLSDDFTRLLGLSLLVGLLASGLMLLLVVGQGPGTPTRPCCFSP